MENLKIEGYLRIIFGVRIVVDFADKLISNSAICIFEKLKSLRNCFILFRGPDEYVQQKNRGTNLVTLSLTD